MDGDPFFVQLHVYNYAGHFCSLKSAEFRIPSLFPPRQGIVMDINQDTIKPPYYDTDVIFHSKTFCFAWNGFGHHEIITFQAGLGTKKQGDDIIQFHNINNDSGFLCENGHNISYNQKYFVTIKVSCSGGTIMVSSDGFTLLNSTAVASSLEVLHGDVCDEVNTIRISTTKLNSQSIKVKVNEMIHPGETFTLVLKTDTNDNIKIDKYQD